MFEERLKEASLAHLKNDELCELLVKEFSKNNHSVGDSAFEAWKRVCRLQDLQGKLWAKVNEDSESQETILQTLDEIIENNRELYEAIITLRQKFFREISEEN